VLFEDFDLVDPLVRAVKEAGYERPTPIQEQAIPPALQGRDLLGCAQTGTGKTAAFALPLLQRLDQVAGREPRLRALVLTPTRELAAQIGESLSTYGRFLDLYHTVIFGGVGERPQTTELRRGVDALVATPGRLLDFMGRRLVRLDEVEIFVLDEADRMLDMGFLPDVRRIIQALPLERQTLLFSATMPSEIRALADRLLRDPVHIAVTPVSSTAERIEEHVFFVDQRDKAQLLVHLLRSPAMGRTLVFSRTKHGANRVAQQLQKAGVRATPIHSNKSQGARTRALEGFKAGAIPVLVATDIAARGIDVSDISHVVNFDLPNVPETYVHRVGRTARAEASGVALSFCDVQERPYLVDIERLVHRLLDRVLDHPYPPTEPLPADTELDPRARATRPQAQRSSPAPRPRARQRAGSPPSRYRRAAP